MSSLVDKPLVGYRLVETRYGDTLQAIAAREMGDASRWPELIAYNNLVSPFITDDEAFSGNGVVLTGQAIRVPAPAVIADAATNPNAAFLSDVQLQNGLVEADADGDFALCEGLPNLRQALIHRVVTQRGELIYHPLYGSLLKRLIGTVNGPTANLLAAQYASAAVESDLRVNRVKQAVAQVTGDRIAVSVEAETISGRPLSLSETI